MQLLWERDVYIYISRMGGSVWDSDRYRPIPVLTDVYGSPTDNYCKNLI